MKKIVYIFILVSQIIRAQEVRVIDNKGTIHKIRNNKVTTSNSSPANGLEGDVWFDNSDINNEMSKIYDGASWKEIGTAIGSKTVILNRNGGQLPTSTNTFFKLPINSAHIQSINTVFYKVVGSNGSIEILKTGNYLISGEISTRNMPSGNTKFILGLFINGVRSGYLSRGSVSLPTQDYWGTTGTIMYALNAGDKVSIEYVINAGGSTLSANFLNIGITKL